jgi:hypothetical protein
MKIKDILKKFSNGEITYGKAKAELKALENHMDEDDYDRIYSAIETIREVYGVEKGIDKDPLDHSFRGTKAILNEFYLEALTSCINMIRDGEHPQDIGTWLFHTYGLDGNLATYFYNEAMDIVKMNTLSSEIMEQIGEEYLKLKFKDPTWCLELIRNIPGIEVQDAESKLD